MRFGKANKLLLRCAQATFGTRLIAHNYCRLEDISKVYGTGKYLNSQAPLEPDKVLSNWCSGHFFYRSLDNC